MRKRTLALTLVLLVGLHPQLEEILREYLRGPHRPTGDLLFPSLATGREAMLTDARKPIDHIAERAGWKPGEIRTKMFRHTYCAARLQTLDGGAPIPLYTVSRELGHTSQAMVRRSTATWARSGIGARSWSTGLSSTRRCSRRS